MTEIGQKPVVLSREIDGFALNRIQCVICCSLDGLSVRSVFRDTSRSKRIIYWYRYAILNETWRLVADGVLSAKDVDVVMSEGLGMRYAFLGAFEAAHLNAEGTRLNCRTQKTLSSIITRWVFSTEMRFTLTRLLQDWRSTARRTARRSTTWAWPSGRRRNSSARWRRRSATSWTRSVRSTSCKSDERGVTPHWRSCACSRRSWSNWKSKNDESYRAQLQHQLFAKLLVKSTLLVKCVQDKIVFCSMWSLF